MNDDETLDGSMNDKVDSVKWTHRSRQLFSEFKLCPFPPLQLVGAAP
jgi:hypothetical protein